MIWVSTNQIHTRVMLLLFKACPIFACRGFFVIKYENTKYGKQFIKYLRGNYEEVPLYCKGGLFYVMIVT